MSSYGGSPPKTKKGMKKKTMDKPKEPMDKPKEETKESDKGPIKSGKMSDKEKADLKKHMDNHKDLKDLSKSELKSHRMKMMGRMRKGMSLKAAHADIM